MEVKAGYKLTEVGVIPEEWKVAPFSGLFNITAGGDVDSKRSQSFKDAIHCHPIYSNALTNYGLYAYCSYADHPAGSITITARGMVGGANYRDHPYTAIGRVLVLQPKREMAGIYFAEVINNRVKFANESTGVPQLTAPQISKYRLPVPPLPEQRAIATALSDVDGLLGGLDRLIAKKRDLKQAAMQQLLTGQTRLPGFHGEWTPMSLSDVGVFKGGSGFPIKYQGRTDGCFPFFKVSDMNNEGNATFMVNSNNFISDVVRKELAATVFPPHSIVFAKIGAAIFLERKKLLTRNSCLDNNMMGFLFDTRVVDHSFLHYLFMTIHLGKLVSTTALPSLNGREIGALQFPFPKHAEQSAIASVLTEMDAELAALEQRREKTRALKQAMMQELLTGRTRLISPNEEAHA